MMNERRSGMRRKESAWRVLDGKTPPFVGGQIAAVARVNNLVLVTFNVSDYEHFEGIQIEDWRDLKYSY